MEIRQLRTDDFEERVALSEFAFQFQLTPEHREKHRLAFRPEHDFGAFDERGALLSALTIIPFEAWVQGKKLAMGGIAGVATWPDARRQGCVSKLLVHALETMRRNGQTISMLHPFSFPFYRKYGWEMSVERKQYTIELNQLPPRKETSGKVERMPKPDIEVLNQVYATYASRFNGNLVRTAEWWEQKILTKPGIVAVYKNEAGEAEGYVFYEVANRTLSVHEMVSANEMCRLALWTFIGNHDSMINQVTLTAAIDDSLPFLLPNPKIKQEIVPYFMSRIVDAENFLGLYKWLPGQREEAVEIALSDIHAPWNNGIYRLEWSVEGSAHLEQITAGEPDAGSALAEGRINCDIQALTAMLIGGKKPLWLQEVGRISGSRESLERLERRIPHWPTYLMDFF